MAAVKLLPVYHHSADYISGPFGSLSSILSYPENRVLFKPVLCDVASFSHFINGQEQTQFNRVCYFHFFIPYVHWNVYIFTATGGVRRGGRKTYPRTSSFSGPLKSLA